MHALEVVIPCQGLISGLLMTPGGSGLVRMEGGLRGPGAKNTILPGLEGCTWLESYPGANKVKLWYSVCLQWPNIHLISPHARLFTHHPPSFYQLSHLSVYPLGPRSVLPLKLRLPAAVNPSLPSPRLSRHPYSLCIRSAYTLYILHTPGYLFISSCVHLQTEIHREGPLRVRGSRSYREEDTLEQRREEIKNQSIFTSSQL